MVGDNIRKHPDEYRMVVEHGHRIGNHTFNHIRGFEYSNPDYLANARKVDEIIHSDLFRPPHGHMGFRQYYTLRYHYRIIMWDLVTRDYSKRMRPEQVLNNVKRYARNGSIITFHDSLKSWNNTVLTPGQLINIKDGNLGKPVKVDVNKYISWIDNLLIYKEEPLEKVLPRLEHYYGKKFVITNDIKDIRISGKLELKERLDKVLHTLSFSFPVTFKEEGDTVWVMKEKDN